MTDMGAPPWMVDGFAELDGLIRNGWAGDAATGVKDVLGRPPRTFKEYAKDYAAGKS